MSNFSRIISFGSSPIINLMGIKTFPNLIAEHIGVEYLCQGKPASGNGKIVRRLINQEYANDFVIVSWSSVRRYEFKTAGGWRTYTPVSKGNSFTKEWFAGPGNLEYTEVFMSLKDIILGQQFLTARNIPYLFVMDNSEISASWTYRDSKDPYIENIKSIIDWNKFLFFDGQGFKEWATENNYPYVGTHPGNEAHVAAADYLMNKIDFNLQ
jgi:hypothetical protein